MTLTPSIAVSEEYNDNVFFDNQNRQSDFITTFSPTLTLLVNRPSYQLTAGYSASAALYAEETSLSNALERQNFRAFGSYTATPGLTLTAFDSFAYNRATNLVAVQGSSTGRQESWNNTFSPGTTWQMAPGTFLNLGLTHSVLRFVGAGVGLDSDSYGFQSSVDRVVTPRLTGNVGYDFAYLDARGTDQSTTHTPTIGLSYQFTPTLTGAISGGVAITEIAGETQLSPAGRVSLAQALQFGFASLQYTRNVAVAGGFGGTTDNQTASGTLALTTLVRGLVLLFSPVYTVAESVASQQTGRVDVKTFTVSLDATYQIARFTSVFAGYTFLHQRTGGSSFTQADLDQNLVRVGVQFGYPFNFDW